jgi:hypothetical protein
MPIDKNHIIEEIKRTAAANCGAPLGTQRFFAETGIKQTDWIGRYWARWGDAIREAGLIPKQMNGAYGDSFLLENYAKLALELDRLPTKAELRLRTRQDPDFPSANVFDRLGRKRQLIQRLAAYCKNTDGHERVSRLCHEYLGAEAGIASDMNGMVPCTAEIGFVYLMKSGRFYKIGHSNAAGRREYELSIQLPEKLTTIHVIPTDDPTGIEAYWHNRFKDKRKNGEWFDLTAAEVAAFKRRKFM